jgi:DNA ligase-1
MMRKKPMLAYPVNDKPIDYDKEVFMQPKLDGVRCLIQYEPLRNKVVAYSRTGKEWKNINHIIQELKPFFAKHPNVILDGELYNHDLKDDFEKIISLVRKTKPTDEDRLESKEIVQFHCYDTIMEHIPFEERNEFILFKLFQDFGLKSTSMGKCIKYVHTMIISSHENALIFHESYKSGGYEGSILRTNNTYQCKRSHNLKKFKDFSDAEATITGYEIGKGKREGTLGKFIMQDDDGIEFGCPPGKGYTYKDMKDMLDNIHDYIGQRATFTFFERTKANSYRHPLFKCIRNYE